jgi:hypothetical protein
MPSINNANGNLVDFLLNLILEKFTMFCIEDLITVEATFQTVNSEDFPVSFYLDDSTYDIKYKIKEDKNFINLILLTFDIENNDDLFYIHIKLNDTKNIEITLDMNNKPVLEKKIILKSEAHNKLEQTFDLIVNELSNEDSFLPIITHNKIKNF